MSRWNQEHSETVIQSLELKVEVREVRGQPAAWVCVASRSPTVEDLRCAIEAMDEDDRQELLSVISPPLIAHALKCHGASWSQMVSRVAQLRTRCDDAERELRGIASEVGHPVGSGEVLEAVKRRDGSYHRANRLADKLSKILEITEE